MTPWDQVKPHSLSHLSLSILASIDKIYYYHDDHQIVIFLISSFILHLLVSILCKEELSFLPFIYSYIYLYPWSLESLFYQMGYNLSLFLLILILKLFWIWLIRAPSSWLLRLFDMSLSLFQTSSRLILLFLYLSPGIRHFSQVPWFHLV